jgi:hypothetical protein
MARRHHVSLLLLATMSILDIKKIKFGVQRLHISLSFYLALESLGVHPLRLDLQSKPLFFLALQTAKQMEPSIRLVKQHMECLTEAHITAHQRCKLFHATPPIRAKERG